MSFYLNKISFRWALALSATLALLVVSVFCITFRILCGWLEFTFSIISPHSGGCSFNIFSKLQYYHWLKIISHNDIIGIIVSSFHSYSPSMKSFSSIEFLKSVSLFGGFSFPFLLGDQRELQFWIYLRIETNLYVKLVIMISY